MKLLASMLLLAGLALAEPNDVTCPTVTREMLPRDCSKRCGNADCMYISTVQNPCGCPDTLPTATLIHPCGGECPNNGCAASFQLQEQPCEETSTRSSSSSSSSSSSRSSSRPTATPAPPTTAWTTRSSSSVAPVVTTSITIITPRPPPCPTVTKTTMPGDCAALRCPVPNCEFQEVVRVPCGCSGPRTELYVMGCSSTCPDGCMTRTRTVSESCDRDRDRP